MNRDMFLTIFYLAALLSFGASCSRTPNDESSNSQAKEQAESNKQPANAKAKSQSIEERERKSRESGQEDDAKASAELDKRVQANAAVADIAKRNNAVVQWEKELGESAGIYTMNLQAVLVRNDRRPILFFGFLNDIAKENGKLLADFDVFPRAYLSEGHFIIECDQIKQIASQNPSPYDEYAVVAVISSVSRPKYRVKAKPLSQSEAEIELDAPDTFLVNGRCLALVHVGSEDK